MALAFPFLLLIIEFSRESAYAALSNSEVLISESLIFPIAVASLTTCALTGVTAHYFNGHYGFYAVTAMGILSVFGYLTAYVQALRVIADRPLMRKKAKFLLRRLVSLSVDWAID